MERGLVRAEEVGNVRAEALCHHALGGTRFLTGEWEACERSLRRGIELASSVGSTFGVILGQHRLALVETATGRVDVAEKRLRDALDVALRSTNPMVLGHSPTRLLTALAENRLTGGDIDAAAAALQRGFDARAEVIAQGFGECVTCDVLLYPTAVRVHLERDEAEAAEWACAQVEESTTWFHSRVWIATAHETRGLLARAERKPDLAADQLDQARAGFSTLGQPYDEARCIAALATVVDGPAAGELAALARRRFRQLGAVPAV